MRPRRSGETSRWFVWDPAGIVIAGFAWVLVFGLLLAVLVSISQWVGLLSLIGVTESIWFTGLFAMCLWSHIVVLISDPGTVPFKLEGTSIFGDNGAEKDDDDVEEVVEEMLLSEFEEWEDDGSLLVYCDECAIYRPSRYVVFSCYCKLPHSELNLTRRPSCGLESTELYIAMSVSAVL